MVFSQTIKGIIVINEVTQKPLSAAMISNERTQLQQYFNHKKKVMIKVSILRQRLTSLMDILRTLKALIVSIVY
jgi:hypothetical protein